MRVLIFTTLTILIFTCFSCEEKNKSNLPIIQVNKNNIQVSRSIDSIIENTKFIALETNDSSLIQEISKIIKVGDKVLISDFKQGKFFVFSKEGKIVSTFQHIGRGPGEYVTIQDICFDKISEEIVVLDPGTRQMLRYDLNGLHISSQKVNLSNIGGHFELFNNSFVFYRHNLVFPKHSNHNIVITDEHQQYINSGAIIPKAIKNLSFWGNNNISTLDSLLYIHPCFNDTIFSINKNYDIIPKVIINTDENLDVKSSRMWGNSFKDIIGFHEYVKKENFIYQTSDFNVLNNNVLYRYFTNSGYSLVVFSMKSNETKIFNNPTFTKDDFIFDPIGKIDNKVIVSINPTKKLNKYIRDNVNLNGNPILCFIEIKENSNEK